MYGDMSYDLHFDNGMILEYAQIMHFSKYALNKHREEYSTNTTGLFGELIHHRRGGSDGSRIVSLRTSCACWVGTLSNTATFLVDVRGHI